MNTQRIFISYDFMIQGILDSEKAEIQTCIGFFVFSIKTKVENNLSINKKITEE